MNKVFLLTLLFSLCACKNGSGSGAPVTAMPDDNTPVMTPEPDIEVILKESEKLFGNGQGLSATPTYLMNRQDELGFKYMSFGAWGNVYNLKETSDNINIKGAYTQYDPPIWLKVLDGKVYDFTTQQNMEIEKWRNVADASVSNAIFTGPAIMYKGAHDAGFYTSGESDYGTMKIQFGYDIGAPARIEFVMSNSDNDLVTNGTSVERFSDDMNNIYIMKVIRDEDTGYLDKVYRGYGHKN